MPLIERTEIMGESSPDGPKGTIIETWQDDPPHGETRRVVTLPGEALARGLEDSLAAEPEPEFDPATADPDPELVVEDSLPEGPEEKLPPSDESGELPRDPAVDAAQNANMTDTETPSDPKLATEPVTEKKKPK